MKTCTKCGEDFPATAEYFHVAKKGKLGLQGKCKPCVSEYQRQYYASEKNRNARRQYQVENAKKYLEYHRQYYATEKYREYHREYNRHWRAIPRNRLSKVISNGVLQSLKNGKEGNRWEDLVGYTTTDLMNHLESQFAEGMTWENYGAWHIDHIIPISSFNFESSSDEEFRQCWDLWNLQPLWAFDNLSKGPRYEAPPLPLLHGETT